MKYCLLLFIVLQFLLFEKTNAQDIHFSQFELSPLNLSPATTGYLSEATDRFTLKYRNQWSAVLPDQAYETIFASYDGRFCMDNTSNFWGYGISAFQDEVGNPSFKTSEYQAAISYHFQLISGYFVSLGFQSGLLRYQLSPTNFDFDNEFDGSVGFNNMPNVEEDLLNDQANIWDVGAGLLFYNPDNAWNMGISFRHITKESYFAFTPSGIAENNRVNTRWTLHASLPFKFGQRGQHFFIVKGMALIQRPHWQFVGGPDFRLRTTKSNSQTLFKFITLGAALRLSNHPDNFVGVDAGIISAKTDVSPNVLMGLSYDVNLSPLQNQNRSVGGFELSLVILLNAKSKNDCLNCFDFDRIKKGKRQKQRKF